jgi:amylo-alpha-1,6-glucosidase/glucodextranase-like protein
VKYSGDLNFIKEMYPKVRLAIEGAMKHRVDELGFLTHQGAETWMDAVTNGREWTPRENRAVEVQVLWAYALKTAKEWAKYLELKDESKVWFNNYGKTYSNFIKYFVNPDSNMLYDHLAKDGTPSKQVRPNQLFAVTIPRFISFLDGFPQRGGQRAADVVRETVAKCVLPYGVISLEQDDPLFMPYHYDDRYHKDAAYHNGTIWQWLAGPAITAMVKLNVYQEAYELTQNMIDEILYRGALGTIAENKNAILRPGEENLTGTVSQAWSLAEFNRNAFQDYLGIKVDVTKDIIIWTPRLPKSWGETKAKVKIGEYFYKFHIRPEDNGKRIIYSIVPMLPPGLENVRPEVQLNLYDSKKDYIVFMSKSEPLSVTVQEKDDHTAEIVNKKDFALSKFQTFNSIYVYLEDIAFAEPQQRESWPGVERLLKETHGDLWEVTRDNPEAVVIADVEDPADDDTGSGAYTYPTNPNYRDGILDLRGFKVKADDDFIYFDLKFTDLVDPGWHPEYGFQLTFASIAIDTDHKAGSGGREIGRHARYTIPEEYAYEKIIYVGGGLLIEDSSNSQVVKLNPPSRKYKLGDADTNMIHLAIPRKYLPGDPKDWGFSVLIGGQDDQGQAGLGNYREVGVTAAEWQGGGAEKQGGNTGIYDTLFFMPE